MQAIFRGRRHFVVGREDDRIWLEQLAPEEGTPARRLVSANDPDLILGPSDEDLDIADAFESGEIEAYEYADGHTYPPGREIQRRTRPTPRVRPFVRH